MEEGGSAGWDRSRERSKWSRNRSEGRGDGASEKTTRSVITGCSECRNEGGQGSVRWMVQAVSTLMMARRGGRVEDRKIGMETKHSGSTSDRKFNVERATVERTELSEITESRSHSIGSPKMVLMMTSEPRPKERVTGEPDTSVYGV